MGQAGLVVFMNVGIVMLIIGFTVLLMMVQFELGPASRLTRGRRWMMTLVLGSGMVAFSIKLAIIATIVHYPQLTIQQQIALQKSPDLLAWESGRFAEAGVRYVLVSQPYRWRALPEVAPAPVWNPTTPEKVALGERLFHDTALSIDRTLACSSCHNVKSGAGDDQSPSSTGVGGQVGNRNAPTVWNAAFQAVLFWDGRAASLEDQALGPPLNPIEMGMPSLQALEQRVREDAAYREMFARAFGTDQPITARQISAAIASYERTLITPDAPYDRYVRGDTGALTPAQQRGMELFQSVGCIQCHSGPNFSGASLFDPPPSTQRLFPVFDAKRYVNRYRLTSDTGAIPSGGPQGVWRIPSLRNVALTAPYFHNGSVDNLPEAVRIMATAQRGKRIVVDGDGNDSTVLRERDVADIVAFLKSLSSDRLLAHSRNGG